MSMGLPSRPTPCRGTLVSQCWTHPEESSPQQPPRCLRDSSLRLQKANEPLSYSLFTPTWAQIT